MAKHELTFMNARCANPRLRSLRVLLAEDSALHQRVATALLEAQGHHVTLAGNGQEVIDSLRRERYDVILMDIEMPVMDGLTATRLIRDRESGEGERLPIVAVTANRNRQECLDAGMDAFLTKPLQLRMLRVTLERLLTRSAA